MSIQGPFRQDSPLLGRVVLGLALLFLIVFVMRAFYSQQASSAPATSTLAPTIPAPTATLDMWITATELIRQATLTAQPTAAQMTQIVAMSQATRTAVAVTRHPLPDLSPTPAPVERTATGLVATLHIHNTAWPVTVAALTAAALDPRTPTAHVNLTPPPAERVCGMWLVIQSDLHTSVNADLEDAGIPTIVVAVPVTGIRQYDCSVQPLQTTFDIVVDVSAVQSDFEGDALLYNLTERILAVLADEYPVTENFGTQRPRLMIDFAGQGIPGSQLPHIDTDYQNALDAYDEGRRGADLIEALGGLLTYR